MPRERGAPLKQCNMSFSMLPHARRLSMRAGSDEAPGRHAAEGLGGRTGHSPLPVGLVVVIRFREGARWRPQRLTPAQAVLSLVEHTVPIRRRPEAAFAALKPAVAGATLLRGARGEAAETVEALLR
jgi:hypothetical protein